MHNMSSKLHRLVSLFCHTGWLTHSSRWSIWRCYYLWCRHRGVPCFDPQLCLCDITADGEVYQRCNRPIWSNGLCERGLEGTFLTFPLYLIRAALVVSAYSYREENSPLHFSILWALTQLLCCSPFNMPYLPMPAIFNLSLKYLHSVCYVTLCFFVIIF